MNDSKKTLLKMIISLFIIVIVGILVYIIYKDVAEPVEGYRGNLVSEIFSKTIVPAVMVDGNVYEWRDGQLLQNPLPENCEYYGEIKYVKGSSPKENCGFVFEFPTTGQIYKIPGNSDSVYLFLTCDTPEDMSMKLVDVVAVFDLKE